MNFPGWPSYAESHQCLAVRVLSLGREIQGPAATRNLRSHKAALFRSDCGKHRDTPSCTTVSYQLPPVFWELSINCPLCLSGCVCCLVLLWIWTQIRFLRRAGGSGGFRGSTVSYRMTSHNAAWNSDFDPLLNKKTPTFNNCHPMEWPSLQACGLRTCLHLIRPHPEKGIVCLCPWALKSVCLSHQYYSA